MKNIISKTAIIIGLFTVSINAQSALSPTSLKLRDLDTLVSFIEQHDRVADTLESIDLKNYTVFFDSGCEANFVRVKESLLKMSMPGPQPGIKFNSNSCALTYDLKEQQ
ncbi:hypothetical protein ACLKMH_24350 [Psychromonas sp. KJ10-10]|uniref:hypothetical protein n=1 Tax=Psychromonas sp. KJ10-10 TaxID=3391823 RepID=UPI0039B39E82